MLLPFISLYSVGRAFVQGGLPRLPVHAKRAAFRIPTNQMSTGTETDAPDDDWSSRLLTLLDTIEPLGTYATCNFITTMPFPYPIITVEGFGRISFPLIDSAVEPLKAVCVKAPFGRGTETLYDETVRRAWQVDAQHITLGGEEAWDKHLQLVVDKACSKPIRKLDCGRVGRLDNQDYGEFYRSVGPDLRTTPSIPTRLVSLP
jgi:hypothetical protein